MNQIDSYIAVFDSGLGGISVLRQLVRQLPRERFLYFGDSQNAPYGTRPTEQVRQLTLQSIGALLPRGLKAVVVACNTATSAAIDDLRRRYPELIVIGIEPALKLAADRFPGGRILVMATNVTLREEKFERLVAHYRRSCTIDRLPCPELVEFVERGVTDGPELEAYLRRTLTPHLSPRPDAIVLGCTHFPLTAGAIARVAGPQVALLDGAEGTARETHRRLSEAGLLRTGGAGSVSIENSAADPALLRLSRQLLEGIG